ncbi:cold shock domain-containing protein [Saccharopolyspora erythraea]|uniref:cold-shock protein n=1 Tax=Saccharopolyspora erythraea TaxID=1836 RepID=UPI001BAE2013|nr:cold shock domain-containing protein [Saccharopolyspora erythraea]QUH01508.1 cold shock domain-containing protein [Saccharopolyspora erythraea]
MQTGRMVRFDEVRGYGFVAPDQGGEDVFVHANDIRADKHLFRPGLRVAFEVEDGERGLKASDVHIVEQPGAADAPQPTGARTDHDDEALCDVLSAARFRTELTEALLEAVPTLTGAQITQVRERVIELGRAHNWIEA